MREADRILDLISRDKQRYPSNSGVLDTFNEIDPGCEEHNYSDTREKC